MAANGGQRSLASAYNYAGHAPFQTFAPFGKLGTSWKSANPRDRTGEQSQIRLSIIMLASSGATRDRGVTNTMSIDQRALGAAVVPLPLGAARRRARWLPVVALLAPSLRSMPAKTRMRSL